jgi:hypothetical protein
MEIFMKSDLVYDDYQWSHYESTDAKISGPPDATIFNRTEGEEVLYIINVLAGHLAWDPRSFGQKVEQLIRGKLPDTITRQDETIQWIKDNWNA